MTKSLRIGGASLIALALALSPAQATFTFLDYQSNQVHEFAFDTAQGGSGNCASNECVAVVPMDKTGTALFSSANPGLVGGLGTAGSPSGGVVSIQGVTSGQAVPVSGTFWQTTQPVSGTFWQTTQPVSGTFWQTTQPVSGTVTAAQATAGSLNATVVGTGTFATQLTGSTNNINNISGTISLPTNAATAANQTSIQGVIGNATAPTDMSVGGLVYNSTPLTLTNGQSSALQGDASGYLNVHIQAGGGSGGTAAADNAAWTAGTTQQTPAGCEYTSGGATALTTAHVGTPACTSARQVFTALFGNTGAAMDVAIGGAAAAANALQIGGVYNSSAPSLTSGYGAALQLTSAGALITSVANTNANVEWNADGVAATTNGSPTTSLMMAYNGTSADRLEDDSNKNLKVNVEASLGIAATGAAVPSSAVYHAGDAQSSEPAATTTGYLTGAFFDLAGKQVVSPYANRENFVHGTASSASNTAVTLLASAGSGLKNYAWVSCGRSDAGTSAIYVTFNDTEGTGSGHILVLPNNGGGGGNAWTDPIPLATAAATALTFTPSASTSTVYCNADGYKGY